MALRTSPRKESAGSVATSEVRALPNEMPSETPGRTTRESPWREGRRRTSTVSDVSAPGTPDSDTRDDRSRPPNLWKRLRGRTGDESGRPLPWRVEGMPDDSSTRTPNQRPRRGGFWWLFVAALAINWILASIVMGPPARTDVSYTFFTNQLDASNVETVTSKADTIQGEFKTKVDYPPGSKDAASVELFTTQRPTFATDDLLGTLQA